MALELLEMLDSANAWTDLILNNLLEGKRSKFEMMISGNDKNLNALVLASKILQRKVKRNYEDLIDIFVEDSFENEVFFWIFNRPKLIYKSLILTIKNTEVEVTKN